MRFASLFASLLQCGGNKKVLDALGLFLSPMLEKDWLYEMQIYVLEKELE